MASAATAERRSALAHEPTTTYAAAGINGSTRVRLAEIAHTVKLNLRGDPADRGFMTAVGKVLDMVLPTDPNTTAGSGAVTALWLGPDEWLLTAPPDGAPGLLDALGGALAGLAAGVVDVGDNSTVIRLAGPRARDVLAKGCPLDLHARAFRPGQVAQSLIAGVDAVLHRTEADDDAGGPVFEIYVRRSFAAYLWRWLADSGLEYGVTVDD
ncbi:MAG: sarcosine oxidase subunit gamma family protein [Alphaproteobacteria bacterium]